MVRVLLLIMVTITRPHQLFLLSILHQQMIHKTLLTPLCLEHLSSIVLQLEVGDFDDEEILLVLDFLDSVVGYLVLDASFLPLVAHFGLD